jgi:hypothetical protein
LERQEKEKRARRKLGTKDWEEETENENKLDLRLYLGRIREMQKVRRCEKEKEERGG